LGRGRCLEQFGTGEAYLPFLDMLGALLAGPERERIRSVLKRHAPTWCLQLPSAFPSSGEWRELQQETIGATKERMLREMGDALGALAAGSPTVLLLEDLHWADPSSIDLLRHLGQRVGKERVLLLGTFRPAELEISNHPLKSCRQEMLAHGQCYEIILRRLSQEELRFYLDSRFAPNDFSGELSTRIHDKTEGHPLFSASLVQFLLDIGHIVRRNEHWALTHPLTEADLEAPESVRGMIRKQMNALAEDDRQALQYASIEGEEFLSTVLATLLEVDELDLEERLDRLARAHRLIQSLGEVELPDGSLATRYRFANTLYQNVHYGDLVTKRRVLLHRRAGEKLVEHYGAEASTIATALAMHFEQGREFGRAVKYLIHAGDNATNRYANAEAKEHFSRAIDLVEKLPVDEQGKNLATLHHRRGFVRQALSQFDEAIIDFTRSAEEARAVDDPLAECVALNALLPTLLFSHRTDEMDAVAEQALGAAERAGNPAMRADTLAYLAMKHLAREELKECETLFAESLRIARAAEHRSVLQLTNRGSGHYLKGEYEVGEKLLSEAVTVASELRDGFQLLLSLFFLGIIKANQGRTSEALSDLHGAVEMAERNGDRYWLPRLLNTIGWIYRELQDFDGALRYDEQSHQMAHDDGVLEAEANALINLAHIYTHMGEVKKAASICREVEDIFERDDFFRWRYNVRLQAAKCECAHAEGDLSRARQDGLRLLKQATQFNAHKYAALAHKMLAEIAMAGGDLAEAETELSAALEELRAYPAPLVAWKTYTLLGRLRLKQNHSAAAREAYAQAADIVRMMASNVTDENLRATFLTSPAVEEVLAGEKRMDS
jgi:tetratricopeptide (TPR) repeat protein